MRALDPFHRRADSLLSAYAANLSQNVAQRDAVREMQIVRAQAAQLVQARAEFLANLSHELRTPLNAIIGFAEMLSEPQAYKVDSEKSRDYAHDILKSADALRAHLDTIISASERERQSRPVQQAPFSLSVMLDEAAANIEIALRNSGATLVVKQLDEPVEQARGDLEHTRRAVEHILRTAIKSASESNARVLARVSASSFGALELEVRDFGNGFDLADLHQLFHAFETEKDQYMRSFDHPAFGLAIAKSLIDAQDGRFSVKSKPGAGTLVRIGFTPWRAPIDDQTDKSETLTTDDKKGRIHAA